MAIERLIFSRYGVIIRYREVMSRATHIPCSGPPDATEFAK
jgi:hypothetical protein